MTFTGILCLYLAFRVKQLTCDFFLQTTWMALNKGKPFKEGGAKALLSHAAVHACFTLLITFTFEPSLWWLAIVDFIVHATVDRLKSMIENKYGWTYTDRAYWVLLGADQEAHNITHLLYIVMIVMRAF